MNNLTKLALIIVTISTSLLGQVEAKPDRSKWATWGVHIEKGTGRLSGDNIEVANIKLSQSPDVKKYKTDAFVIKYRDPDMIYQIISSLLSDEPGAFCEHGSYDDDFGVIIIRDFPEVVDAIGLIIRKLDVPTIAPASTNVQLTIYVIWASKVSNEMPGVTVSPVISDVVSTVSKAFGYKYYKEAGTMMQLINSDNIGSNSACSGNSRITSIEDKSSTKRFAWSIINSATKDDYILNGLLSVYYDGVQIFDNIGFLLKDGGRAAVATSQMHEGVDMLVIVSANKQ